MVLDREDREVWLDKTLCLDPEFAVDVENWSGLEGLSSSSCL